MRTWIVRLAIAACAFTSGLAAVSLVRAYYRPEKLPSLVTQGCSEMAAPAPGPPSAALLPTPSYCELVKKADCYDGQVVRVRSKLDFSDEGMYFYEDACNGMEGLTAGQLDGISPGDFDRMLERACSDQCYGPLDVVVTGRFEKVVPSHKSNLLWDIYPLHLRIISVEKMTKWR